MEVTRKLLGAPAQVPIMLAVDELSKAGEDPSFPPSKMMRILTSMMDQDHTLYLSISAYGCLTLSDFATNSNRLLLLQPLPPIFPMNSLREQQLGALPPILQAFADETVRTKLPHKREHLEVYAEVSQLLIDSGGHPRRIQCLMAVLKEFKPKVPLASEEFATELSKWMRENEGRARAEMEKLDFPSL